MTDERSTLGITMGDPAGVGPEIVVKAVSTGGIARPCVVFGCPYVIRRAVEILGAPLAVHEIEHVRDVAAAPGRLFVLPTGRADPPAPFGVVSPDAGRAAFDAIRAAIRYASEGALAGIVTAPIHKEALAAAGIDYPGHTEILADLGGAERVAMMLGNDEIRTVLVTIHCSLTDAIRDGTFDAQMNAIRLADVGAKALGYAEPRVAVAGLNPHAGEGGLFGREEIEIIGPAIAAAREEGIDASGPWSGDTVFMQARQGRFDIVVAQYHDQGLIPVKYMGLEKGVNITLGLPFIRTSPDHGTAFDIAGTGEADPSSLITAIGYAERMIRSKLHGSLSSKA